MNFLRKLFEKKQSESPVKAKEVRSEIEQQIPKIRQDNPQLTKNMSDEEIIVLIQQADQAVAQGRPTAFIVQRPGSSFSPLEGDEHRMTAKELVLHGEKLKESGQWQEAEQIFLKALERAKQEDDLLYQSWAIHHIGDLCRDKGDMSQAVMRYENARELAEKIENQDGQHLMGVIHNGIGNAYRMQGYYPQAVEQYKESLKICKQIGDVNQLAITTGNLGNVYLDQGDLDQAFQVFNDNLDASLQAGLDHESANAYTRLGVVYLQQGCFTLALDMMNKSIEICTRIGNQPGLSINYCNLGIIYEMNRNYPRAIEMYQKAANIMQQTGDEPNTATVHGNLANLYKALGDLEQAQSHYIQALKIIERTGDRHGEAINSFNLGQLYCEKGEIQQARVHLRKAQTLFEMVGDTQKAQIAAQVLRSI